MDLIKYSKVEPEVLANELKDSLGLDIEKGREIEDYFRYKGYYVVYKPKTKKVNILLRMSAIFYFIYIFILILFMPLKWLYNGELHYKYDGGIFAKVAQKWKALLNF